MGIAIGILVIVVLVLFWIVGMYNSMVKCKLLVENAKSQISVQLKSRWALVENLISATGKYSEHEKDTLMGIVKARTPISGNISAKEISASESELGQIMGKLSVVVEAYPDLKANTIYLETMQSTKEMEADVKRARMIYNDTATRYNRSISVIPNVFFAGIFGFNPVDLIEHKESESEMPRW